MEIRNVSFGYLWRIGSMDFSRLIEEEYKDEEDGLWKSRYPEGVEDKMNIFCSRHWEDLIEEVWHKEEGKDEECFGISNKSWEDIRSWCKELSLEIPERFFKNRR